MTRTALLSDEMWARVEPVLPPVKGALGRPMREHRDLVEGAIYRYRTPASLGVSCQRSSARGRRVWKRHHRFSTDGTWDKVLSALQVQADGRGEIDWKVSVDSTSVRVHQHGATAARVTGGPSSHTGGRVELHDFLQAQRRA